MLNTLAVSPLNPCTSVGDVIVFVVFYALASITLYIFWRR